MNNYSRLLVVSVTVFAVLSLSACSVKRSDNAAKKKEISPLACVVLLPTISHYSETDNPKEDKGDLEEGARVLDTAIMDALQKSKVGRVVDTEQLQVDIEEISGGKPGAIEDISREAQCNVVLVTALMHYRQRQGGEYAVDTPASAAFEMKLVDAQTGQSMWTANFSETQTSLMSNLFAFGKALNRGFKWITVEDLVEQGVHEKMYECPYFY